jgi:hypothetical protein
LESHRDFSYWIYACFFGLNVCSRTLVLIIFSLYTGICWQIYLRFKSFREYLDEMLKQKSLNIKVERVSKFYNIMFSIIQQTNENFGIYQLFLTGTIVFRFTLNVFEFVFIFVIHEWESAYAFCEFLI